MGIVYVKTAQEMNTQNRLFNMRVKSAQTRALLKMSKINQDASKKFAETVKYTGYLMASIGVKSLSSLKHEVICSAPYGSEIEFGLEEPRVWIAPIEELDKWRKHKSAMLGKTIGRIGKEVVDVSPSPSESGIPHPKGLHFMEHGFDIAFKNVHPIITQELRKLN